MIGSFLAHVYCSLSFGQTHHICMLHAQWTLRLNTKHDRTTPPTTPCCLQAGGLHESSIQRLMVSSLPAPVLVDTLLVVSQLARLNKESFNTYEPIAKAGIYPHIRS